MSSSSGVPKFVVNLDDAPAQRWGPVIAAYKDVWPGLVKQMMQGFMEEEDASGAESEAFIHQLSAGILDWIKAQGHSDYVEELEAIAVGGGVKLSHLLLLHLSYESHAGCTSIAIRGPGGQSWLARTLDWDLPLLKKLTIEVTFTRGGKTAYVANTWAGYVGVYTAMIPRAYALAINFREGDPDSYIPAGVSWPIGFFVRHVVETTCASFASNSSSSRAMHAYRDAARLLITTTLMSPCYVVMTGPQASGVLITRAETGELRRKEMGVPTGIPAHPPKSAASSSSSSSSRSKAKRKKGKKSKVDDEKTECVDAGCPFLMQANMDHWVRATSKDNLESLPRTNFLGRHIKDMSKVTVDTLWGCLFTYPIWDEDTIHGTLMSPHSSPPVFLSAAEPDSRYAASRKKHKGGGGGGGKYSKAKTNGGAHKKRHKK